MLPDKRFLYVTSKELIAYLWKGGHLRREATFGPGDEGVDAFARYVSAAPRSLFYLLADVVEEDFLQENIPYLRGGDRRALLARKLAQRYRDTSLALMLSLGNETTTRREERILYSSFTNTQQFQTWLGVLRSGQARIAGVYSISLVTPLLGRQIGLKSRRYMMVSLQQAGLRQSYVENNRIRFSRLGRIETSDSRALADAFAAESGRFHQYLVNSRILSRDNSPLDVFVLAPGGARSLYEAACANTAHLRFHVQDLDKVARAIGLKSAPAETLAERVFLGALARVGFAAQFADDSLRRFYDLWRARIGLVAGGTAVFLLCLVLSAAKLFEIARVDEMAATDRLLEADATRQYARMQATFPQTPIPAEVLKTTVKNYRSLLQQEARLGDIFADISQALAAVPQIDLEKIDWEIGALKRATARDGGKAPATVVAGATPEPRMQLAEISGRLLVQQASDYRNISLVVNQFVEALRSRPGIEVVSTRLPFDINAEKSISGDIGATRSTEVPRFSVLVSKRLGS